MSSFVIDAATGDLKIVNGRLTRVTGAQEKAQKIRNRLRLFVGEWFLDTRVGVPWYGVVFVKNPDLELVKTMFRRAILSVPGIARVENVNVEWDRATRALSYTFDCVDDEGVAVQGGSGAPFILGDLRAT